jgi:hypothetical protein
MNSSNFGDVGQIRIRRGISTKIKRSPETLFYPLENASVPKQTNSQAND